MIAAYRQYADLIAPDIFSPYLADVLDLDKHARHGRLLVVEADGQVCGFGAFYPDASVQGLGWPPGWASGRALAVHPGARAATASRAPCSPPASAWPARPARRSSPSTRPAS